MILVEAQRIDPRDTYIYRERDVDISLYDKEVIAKKYSVVWYKTNVKM